MQNILTQFHTTQNKVFKLVKKKVVFLFLPQNTNSKFSMPSWYNKFDSAVTIDKNLFKNCYWYIWFVFDVHFLFPHNFDVWLRMFCITWQICQIFVTPVEKELTGKSYAAY